MALVSGPTIGDAIADPSNELTKLVAPRDRRRQADRRAVPADPQPAGDRRRRSTPAASESQSIDEDHRKLAEALGRRETEVALKRPAARDASALAAIAAAQAALAAYEKELAPKLAAAGEGRRPPRPPSSRPT